ncbi:MAG: carbohydrate ABC transporter substrate-binding protein [Mogibacterium sp.]|nr:carbohydrate ABC transporter substrate-binding protein [Mogibacterium sp.]
MTVFTMCLMLLAGCSGSSGEEEGNTGSTNGITIFNSKMEIQDQLLQMAEKYEAETGVHVEVYYSSDTVSAHMATRYAANNPYTLSMVDAKDIYALAEEHAIDLSDEAWVEDTGYEISIGGKVYGFPVCVEARGIIYNADAIEKITGEKFDPEQYKTLTAWKGLLEELKAGGMENPTGVMKEDWSLGAHYLAQIYEEQDDPDAFLMDLSKGKVSLMDNEKFNSLMDTFDVLMENNYAKKSAISAEREVSEKKLAEGEIAFMFGGNWDWSQINQFDYTENMGMMPVPQDTDDGTNEMLVGGGSKYFFIDNSSNTTDEQRQQAKDFLNWLVYSEEGQSFMVNDCALVPAFSNIELPISDPLGASVSKYTNEGKLIPNYNYMPDDHYAILGAMFQKYLAGISDRKEFAKDVETYWHTKTLTSHSE